MSPSQDSPQHSSGHSSGQHSPGDDHQPRLDGAGTGVQPNTAGEKVPADGAPPTPGASSTDYSADPAAAVEPAHGSTATIEPRFPDPGLPPHVHRRTDVDPAAARRAERQVSAMFLLSVLGTVGFVLTYFLVESGEGSEQRVLLRTPVFDVTVTTLLGLTMAVALFALGAGAVHWAKTLMPDDEVVEERHPIRSTDSEREAAAALLAEGGAATGLPRRRMIWGTLIAASGALGAMAAVPLLGLWSKRNRDGRPPYEQFEDTVWSAGMRLLTDPTGEPIKAADIPIGGVIHVIPEVPHDKDEPAEAHSPLRGGLSLTELAKAVVLVIRLDPNDVEEREDRRGWSYNGIVAYSKICTHVGCPVPLYEQTTKHLLCPCHQSTFDVPRHCEVIFGPASRPLPQLAIGVDAEGYLIAKQGFQEPIGPSYWERG